MMSGGAMFMLGIIFLLVVAPIWIIAHYATRWRAARRLSGEDEKALAEIWQSARRMEARIEEAETMTWTNSSNNPFRLYRDTERGILAGVCAGIADYIGAEPIVVRLATVLGLFFFFPVTLIAYVVLAIALRPKPPALYANRDEEDFWRGVSTAPADTLQSLRRKFRNLEDRLGQMEGQIASGDFDLHRKFRDLDR